MDLFTPEESVCKVGVSPQLFKTKIPLEKGSPQACGLLPDTPSPALHSGLGFLRAETGVSPPDIRGAI